MVGSNRSARSTMVTRAPSLASAVASSTPMYPPPTTAIDSGTRSSRSRSVLLSTRVPLNGNPGSATGWDPVAMITSRYSRKTA